VARRLQLNGRLNVTEENTMNQKVWIGIAVGAGIGIAYAVSARSRRSRWDRWDPKEMRKKFAHQGADLVDRGKEMMDRIRVIYEEGRKVVDDAGELWNHGRKLVQP
jgi:hypothetical protein